jgi:uncharacterized membrane protein
VGLVPVSKPKLSGSRAKRYWLPAVITSAAAALVIIRRPRLEEITHSLGRFDGFLRSRKRKPSVRHNKGIKVQKSVLINQEPPILFEVWRNFENLPKFMQQIDAVQMTGEKTSHWTLKAAGEVQLEWDAEVHNEIENELIAWRSLPGSDVRHAGSVHFQKVPGKHATRVRLVISYEFPGGKIGKVVSNMLGLDAAEQTQEDLNRFRELTEFGEILPTEEESMDDDPLLY